MQHFCWIAVSAQQKRHGLELNCQRLSDTDKKNRPCDPFATVAAEPRRKSLANTIESRSLALHVGFLRKLRSVDDLTEEMTALEEAGCERIVVETGPAASDGIGGLLGTVVERLSDGDALMVWSLDSVARSLRELIDLAIDLEARNVRFRSLTDGFDTHGRQRSAIRTTLVQLQAFKRRVQSRRDIEAANNHDRRVGRPRSLSPKDIEDARSLIKQGNTLDDVARKFNVSKATIYRYLEENGH